MRSHIWIAVVCCLAFLAVPTVLAQGTECPPCVCPCATPLPPGAAQYTLQIGKIEDPATPGWLAKLEVGQEIVAVEFIISNVAGKPLDIDPTRGVMVDTDGFSYRGDLGLRDGTELDIMTLNPGEKARGWIGFQVPAEAKVSYIKFALGGFGDATMQSAPQP